MSTNPPGDYEVGYCKPPKDRQWKPGQSGNPRPKKRKDYETSSSVELFEAVRKALGRKINVPVKGRTKRVTLRQYLVDLYIQSVVKDPRALVNLFKLIERADRSALEGKDGTPLVVHVFGGLPDGDDDSGRELLDRKY